MPQYVWTYRLEDMLVRHVNREGCNWETIKAKYFPEFSVTALKNKWQRLKALGEVDAEIADVHSCHERSTKHPALQHGENMELMDLLKSFVDQLE